MLTTRRTKTDDDPHAPRIDVTDEGNVRALRLSGAWTTQSIAAVDEELRAMEKEAGGSSLRIDMSGVERIDTAGAWLIYRLTSLIDSRGGKVEMTGASTDAQVLLEAVAEVQEDPSDKEPAKRPPFPIAFLETLGQGTWRVGKDAMLGMHILGATIRGGQLKMGRGHSVNMAAIASQIDRMGIGAIPVVVLMSAIVGAIVAQQGAFQLRYFGAEIFVVDLVGILVLRELGVLLTAIMIAGRSGSAITAEIGSMKMREEVDALTVIGLNPVGVLVFPRLVALLIALPCLTILANFAALGGAMAVSWYYSGIAPEAFIDRLRASIDLSTILSGLIKAPFMAMIIGIVAAVEGMKVEGSAESLGRRVTASVVKAIFIVIVVDGMFAMFYAAVDF